MSHVRLSPSFLLPAGLAFAFLTCSTPPSSPDASLATGPPPVVEITPGFGASPLSGFVRLIPAASSEGWRYRVEPITTEPQAWRGVVDGPVSIPFRIEESGIHTIRAEFEGPDGPVTVEERVIVSDSEADFEVLAQRPLAGIVDYPEGIAIDPEGRWLYVAGYRYGQIARLDAHTLEVQDRTTIQPHVAGLSITPDGDRLVAVHELPHVSVLRLPDLELAWESPRFGRFFSYALDERRALLSGRELRLVDLDRREAIAEAGGLNFWHFAVDPAGQRVAVIEGESVEIRTLSSLSLIRRIPGFYGQALAFDPHEDKLYVMTDDRLLVIDPSTGTTLVSIVLDRGCVFCSANPVATFASGRYVAFERSGAVDIVDTELDLPRFRFDGGHPPGSKPAAVAALPESDVFYVLGGPEMAVYKLRVRRMP